MWRASRGRRRRTTWALASSLAAGGCGAAVDAGSAPVVVEIAAPPASGSAPAVAEGRRPPGPAERVVLEPGLEILDERIGQGRVARRGDTVAIAYVAVGEDGGEVDSSYAAGETVTFRIGAGRVIPGIERGVVGMREGGQRRLRVAPALAFGDLGHAYGVAPGATVVFVVELVTVE